MLNQDWNVPEPEFVGILVIRTAPTNGNIPKMRPRVLYLPVLYIIRSAKTDPVDIEMLFGIRCRPSPLDEQVRLLNKEA